ncbi:MAG TPA: hypothetical protein VMT34_13525 [Aggregatilineales bacterium]|nr:hypothetical protein [Aggregatilineales bacterium]
MANERETKLPRLVYIDGLPYATEEQIARRRERLAALGLPDDSDTATTIKPERPSVVQPSSHDRDDITG